MKTEFCFLRYVPRWDFSSVLSCSAKPSLVPNVRSPGAHTVTLMLHCTSSAEGISTLHSGGCSLARYHGGEVDMESCTAAFHRQGTAVARCYIMSKMKHSHSRSASKLFWMVWNWFKKPQTNKLLFGFLVVNGDISATTELSSEIYFDFAKIASFRWKFPMG